MLKRPHQMIRQQQRNLWLAALLAGTPSALLAEGGSGLPYASVQAEPIVAIDYVLTTTDPISEPEMIEVLPDRYSARYRNGRDVYKMMPENSFDTEPMRVIIPQIVPAMQLPAVVVTVASSQPTYTHVTAAQRVIDPVARGEDLIYRTINLPSEPPGGAEPLTLPPAEPKQRRFFSTPLR